MGQDLHYRSGDAAFQWRITRADWDTLQSLLTHLPAEVDMLFLVPNLGDELEIESDALRAAAIRLDAFLADNSHLLPHTYQFKLGKAPHPLMDTGFDSGAVSGLRLPGDTEHFFYTIHAGLDQCYLEKMGIGTDGRGVLLDRRDLRDQAELPTENFGTITIRKRRAKSELRRTLKDILAFLDRCTECTVIKTVA